MSKALRAPPGHSGRNIPRPGPWFPKAGKQRQDDAQRHGCSPFIHVAMINRFWAPHAAIMRMATGVRVMVSPGPVRREHERRRSTNSAIPQ